MQYTQAYIYAVALKPLFFCYSCCFYRRFLPENIEADRIMIADNL